MLQLFEDMILNEAAPRRAKQLNINPDNPPDLTQANPQQQQPQQQDQQPPEAQAQEPAQDPNAQPDPQQMQQDMPQDDQQAQDPNGEGGGEEPAPEDGQEEAPQGPEGMEAEGQPQDELDQAEAETFSELKPDQFAIKIKELKQQYKSLNDSILSTLEKMSKITKTSYDANMIDYITRKLLELKDLSRESLIQAFPTRTYIENQIELQRMIMTFNMLTNMMEQIYDSRIKRAAKYNKEDNTKNTDVFSFGQDITI